MKVKKKEVIKRCVLKVRLNLYLELKNVFFLGTLMEFVLTEEYQYYRKRAEGGVRRETECSRGCKHDVVVTGYLQSDWTPHT